MSGINFHFQLDSSRPDEERALQILESMQRSGWHLQKIVITALLLLDERQAAYQATQNATDSQNGDANENLDVVALQTQLEEFRSQTDSTLHETKRVLHRLHELIEAMPRGSVVDEDRSPTTPMAISEAEEEQERISADFLASVKKAFKPGIGAEGEG